MEKHRGRGLFAISSLGLGHATRSLAIINAYLDDGWSLTIVSAGSALQMLRSELAGPFSWFIPTLAGAFQQPYGRFALFNALGVIVGIGEFLVLGYLLGNNLERLSAWLARFGCIPLALAVTVLPAMLLLRRQRLRQTAANIAR